VSNKTVDVLRQVSVFVHVCWEVGDGSGVVCSQSHIYIIDISSDMIDGALLYKLFYCCSIGGYRKESYRPAFVKMITSSTQHCPVGDMVTISNEQLPDDAISVITTQGSCFYQQVEALSWSICGNTLYCRRSTYGIKYHGCFFLWMFHSSVKSFALTELFL